MTLKSLQRTRWTLCSSLCKALLIKTIQKEIKKLDPQKRKLHQYTQLAHPKPICTHLSMPSQCAYAEATYRIYKHAHAACP